MGVQLSFNGKPFVVCSTHLPCDGYLNQKLANEITETHFKENKMPIIIGGDFNIERNVFANVCETNLSGMSSTYFNNEKAKYDWVVGTSDVNVLGYSVNSVGQSIWPNESEGSDHTSTRLLLNI